MNKVKEVKTNRLCKCEFNLMKGILKTILSLLICMHGSFFVNGFSLIDNSTKKIELMFQQANVSGVISDSKGPLAGVSVIVKGTDNGTNTDSDGTYTLEIDGKDAILEISYVGYSTQEINVGSKSSINIIMIEDTSKLDEIVVLGYTTRKKGEVTGSVSTINSESLEKSGNKDLAKSLAGVTTGLIVSDRGGYPGSTSSEDLTLLIRGKSTLGDNSPLILIDNIPADSFSHLSPQDIETLTVLKDGAAAIYGARAANGVILVTTKRGKKGKLKINFNTSYNLSKFSETPKRMSSEQFAIYQNEINAREGNDPTYSEDAIKKYASGEDPINFPNTNWSDLTLNKYSPEYRATLSASGGSEIATYFIGADHINQQGLYHSGALNFSQNQIRTNIDFNIIKIFSLGVDLSGRFGERNEPGVSDGEIYNRINTNKPVEVGLYPNGLPGWGGQNGQNPYVMVSNQSGFRNRIDNNLRGKFSYTLDLNDVVQGLIIKGFAGVVRNTQDLRRWYTPFPFYRYNETTGKYDMGTGYSNDSGTKKVKRNTYTGYNSLFLNSTIHYNNTFNIHTISGFVGAEQSNSDESQYWVERKGFPSSTHSELSLGDTKGQLSNSTSSQWARVNFFGSASYDYDKKYFLDVTLRYDGSSSFGPDKKFGLFPGVAGSWAINRELFMKNLTWINSLRLRASWSIMGNDRIAPYQYLTKYNYGGGEDYDRGGYSKPYSYIIGSPGNLLSGYSLGNFPNQDITWEKAQMRNFGVSFSILNNRLSGDINYFIQNREDILVTKAAAIPEAVGLVLPAENIGKVDNFGWELELGWKDKLMGGDIGYSIGGNFTQAKNQVVYLAEAVGTPDRLKREGHPLDSYVVYPTKGLFKTQADVDAEPAKLQGTVEGEPYYIDVNGDGQISSLDRTRKYTSNIPEIQYGIFGSINYKNIELSFLLQGQSNVEILVFFERGGSRPAYLFDQRWTPNNRNAKYPRAFGEQDRYSGRRGSLPNGVFEGADLWFHDASFLRLKQLELGYTFSKNVIKTGHLKLFLRGFNLFTMFSDISDLNLDPEANGYYDMRLSNYPSLTTYTGGLNFTF